MICACGRHGALDSWALGARELYCLLFAAMLVRAVWLMRISVPVAPACLWALTAVRACSAQLHCTPRFACHGFLLGMPASASIPSAAPSHASRVSPLCRPARTGGPRRPAASSVAMLSWARCVALSPTPLPLLHAHTLHQPPAWECPCRLELTF